MDVERKVVEARLKGWKRVCLDPVDGYRRYELRLKMVRLTISLYEGCWWPCAEVCVMTACGPESRDVWYGSPCGSFMAAEDQAASWLHEAAECFAFAAAEAAQSQRPGHKEYLA